MGHLYERSQNQLIRIENSLQNMQYPRVLNYRTSWASIHDDTLEDVSVSFPKTSQLNQRETEPEHTEQKLLELTFKCHVTQRFDYLFKLSDFFK